MLSNPTAAAFIHCTRAEGDNTVLMQSVARPLLDAAVKAGVRTAPPPPAVMQGNLCTKCCGRLLAWRRDMLVAGLAGEMGAAGGKGGPKVRPARARLQPVPVPCTRMAGRRPPRSLPLPDPPARAASLRLFTVAGGGRCV